MTGLKAWRKGLVLVGTLVAIALALYWAFGPGHQPPESLGDGGRTRFSRPHFVGYQGGVRQWSLQAESIEEAGADQPGVLLMEDIKEGVLYRDGEVHLTFHARRGIWKSDEGELELEGDVVFYDEGVHLLSAEKVLWDSNEEQITVPVRVYATLGGDEVEADFLEARLAEERVELRGNVFWTTKEGVEVRAAHALYVDNEAAFTGLLEPVRVPIKEDSPRDE